jgi:hypothetical protein
MYSEPRRQVQPQVEREGGERGKRETARPKDRQGEEQEQRETNTGQRSKETEWVRVRARVKACFVNA